MEVWTKVDAVHEHIPDVGLALSVQTGQGLQAIRQELLKLAGWAPPEAGTFIARARHTQALGVVSKHLQKAHTHLCARTQSLDLLAEELRLAQNALSEITGAFSSDDLLGVIFSKFCIGK
jgi:tRNA modification GTPase